MIKNMTKNKSIVKTLKQGKIKREKHNKIKNLTPQDEVTKAVRIFFIVIIVLILTYLISGIVTGEIKFKDDIEKATIQYDEILIGTSFTQKEAEYYVLMYNYENDDNATTYQSYVSSYEQTDTALKIYYANLNVSLNKIYISDNVNYNPTKASEVRVSDATIIKISNGQLSLFITGKEKVLSYLSGLK
jgi:hypothetical protein